MVVGLNPTAEYLSLAQSGRARNHFVDDDLLPWRNWTARMTSNHKAAGSSPAGSF